MVGTSLENTTSGGDEAMKDLSERRSNGGDGGMVTVELGRG